MNIAFDAKRITHNATGLGNYSRFVVGALAEFAPEHNYQLYSPSLGKPQLYQELLEYGNLKLFCPSSIKSRVAGGWWRNFGLKPTLRSTHADIYHGLSNELPIGLYHDESIKTIVTIHDLAFVRYPQYYRPIDRWLYRSKYGASARNADHVVAVSHTTKQDIMEHFGVDEQHISVIYQGCAPSFAHVSPEERARVQDAYQLPSEYILFVGSLEERKNLLIAVRALALLQDKHIPLIAVGKRTPYCHTLTNEAHRLGLGHRLRLIHGLPHADLAGVYAGASVFVYPSRFEGFGIPIIEAISAGIPAIGATGSCLEEAGGPHSLYTHPDKPDQLASLIELALHDSVQRENMIVGGKNYIKRFSPKTISRQLRELYESIHAGNL